MNKLGVIYSGYKPMIPLGNRIGLNMKLDDYQKGDFFYRRPCDHDLASKYIYISMRTYGQRIEEALKEKPKEIFLLLDTPGNDFDRIDGFFHIIIRFIRYRGYAGNVIVSLINEPLEHCELEEVHSLNSKFFYVALKYAGVYFAVGNMATNYPDFWRSFLNCGYKWDYISFHTDDNCNVSDLKKFLDIFPKGTKFLDTEHYYYDGAKHLGYNNGQVVRPFEDYTKFLLNDGRVKSVYCCMPFHAKDQGKYPWLGLNTVDLNTDRVYSTVAWKMLRQYDIKEEIIMKLSELKRGDYNLQVRALQLCLLNADCDPQGVDGWFGKNTEKAIEKFNNENSIRNSKVCSYETWFILLTVEACENIILNLLTFLDYV